MADGGEVRTGEALSFGPFRLTVAERLLVKDGNRIGLGGRAFDLLIALTDRPGEVVSTRQLSERVWPNVIVEEGNLRVHVAALRKALGDGKDGLRYIVNVPGRGYTFVAPVSRRHHDGSPPASGVARPVRSHHLPAPPHSLVGRDETVTMLSALLLSRRLVSVVGPGGIGKTTVALAVAQALRQDLGDDAVCFVDLGSLTNPADVSGGVASALGCFVQGPDPEPYIHAFLADKRILVVLDSCEHVIEAVAPLVERLIRERTSAHLLVTSREALRVRGENVHLLTPLDSPSDDTVSAVQALASPAVQLFMERAASSGHEGALGDAEAPVVAKICRRLDGIALAIELVASRVGTFGIQGTADLLDSGTELFLQGRRNALPRHQTLQAMLDWSFRLLPAEEQKILTRLSVFVGAFTLAAHTVVGDAEGETQNVANVIASLVDKSLISISPTGGPYYYRLLDTTRVYAAAKLSESGWAEEIARRHASYFAALLKDAPIEGSVLDGRSIATYAPHMGNIREALTWSFSGSGDRTVGVELAAHAAPLFLGLSLMDECQKWCRRALGDLSEAHRGTLVEVKLLEGVAISSMYTRGNSQEVRVALDRGLELSESLRSTRHQLYLLSGLTHFLTRRGDFNGALATAQRCAAVAQTSGDAAEKAMSVWLLGVSYHLAGDQAAALRQCRLGLEIMSNVTPAWGTFFDYGHNVRGGFAAFARALWLCGFPDQGYKAACQGIEGLEGLEHPVPYCIVILFSVPVLQWSAELQGAARHTERAIANAAKYSLPPYLAMGLALKGELMVASGEAAAGVQILREALKAMDASKYDIVTLSTLRAFAEGLALCGALDEALATIEDAVARAEQVSSMLWAPDLLRARGEILLAQTQPDFLAAEDSLLRSIEGARKQSALSWELKAAIPLARLWGERGRIADARSMLGDIYRRFTEGFGTRDLIAARRLLDELQS